MLHKVSKPRNALAHLGLVTALLAASFPALAQTGSGSDGSIDKCERILGTLAVAEPQSQMIAHLTQYKLGSPSTMLRMIAQESNCFTVVERGVAMQNLQQERALASGGMMQQGSNMGGGQLQAADFVMTPSVQFSADTGGIGGAVGGLFGRMGGVLGQLGGLAGGVSFKEAETTLLVADVRSGIQVASAEGKASKMNFSLGGWGWGGMGWASAGGYSKTPEGKLIAASLLDNYNRIVQTIKSKPSLIQATSQASQVNAANSIQATPMGGAAGVGAASRMAPAPVQVAQPVASGGNLPVGLVGNFVGSFSGQDEGGFNAVVASNGVISGSGYSSKYKAGFVASGMVTGRGEMQMTGSGQAGGATFTGQIDPASGMIIGQWQWVSGPSAGSAGGSFQGKRQ
jgi:Curli production assembly/transport component CsgG